MAAHIASMKTAVAAKIPAMLFARWVGYPDIAFGIAALGAFALCGLCWMTFRTLVPGNAIGRSIVTMGLGISGLVLAAGYSGLSLDGEAGEGRPWYAFVKFGQADYVIMIFGSVLFLATLIAIVRMQVSTGWIGSGPPTAR